MNTDTVLSNPAKIARLLATTHEPLLELHGHEEKCTSLHTQQTNDEAADGSAATNVLMLCKALARVMTGATRGAKLEERGHM